MGDIKVAIIEEIRQRLYEIRDTKTEYRHFNARTVHTVDEELVLGVRTPQLRDYAKELSKRGDIEEFLSDLPHKYFEENQLQSFIISLIKDEKNCIEEIDRFLPYIDNWATCDQLIPNVFKKHKEMLLPKVYEWIKSDKVYTIRFAVKMLMTYYLDEDFDVKYLDMATNVTNQDYYVKMMVAWYFATALSKQYDIAITYIENKKLEKWTHNKAIQKAIESYRISDAQKEYLKTLRIK